MAIDTTVRKRGAHSPAAADETPIGGLFQAIRDRAGVSKALATYLGGRLHNATPSQRLLGDVARQAMTIPAATDPADVASHIKAALLTTAELAIRSNERQLAAEAVRFAHPKVSPQIAQKIIAQANSQPHVAFSTIIERNAP